MIADAFKHPYLKLVALLVAVLAWGWVQGRQVIEDRVRCSVIWQLPSGLSAAEPLPSSVSVLVSGSRSALRRAAEADLRVVADLREGSRGEQSFEFSNLAIEGVPGGVTVLGMVPTSVRVVLDEVDRRKVKLSAVTVGDPPPGFVVRSIEVEPSVIQVIGPRSVVAGKTSVSTKPVDVSGIVGAVDVITELDLGWGVTYEGPPVTVRVEVQSVQDRLTLTEVPIAVLDPRGGWTVDVPSVEVELEGPAAALAALSHERVSVLVYLPAQPADRMQVGLARSGARMEVVNLPPDARVVGVRPSVVRVTRGAGGTLHPAEPPGG